ncbi:hypothetical protein [Ruminococcus sp. 5_1_39BFAA]|uniref:hypothetical protein n=1 Tax=Ruminococcus sp. 5_1_39BFAA TaxID=457412 RepID=UPI003568DD26
MDKKMWEQGYPQMPEAFRLAVRSAVEENLKTESGKPEKIVRTGRRKKRRYLLLLAAALMAGIVAAMGVTAAKKEQKQSPQTIFMKTLGLEERNNLDSVLQKDVTVKAEETPTYKEDMDPDLIKSFEKRESNDPILAIPMVLYDGQRLAIYAEPTEQGEKYDCEAWELRINDQLIGPIEMEDNLGKQDYYIFQTKTDDLKLTSPFEVTIPLRVYHGGKRYENQDLTFTVDIEAQLKELPDQSFVCKEYSVKVTDLKQSLTSLQGKVTVEMTREQRAAYVEGNTEISELLFRSREGTFWKRLGGSFGIFNDGEESQLRDESNYVISYPADTETDISEDSEKAAPCIEYGFYYQIPEDDPQSVLLSFMGLKKDLPNVGDIPAGQPVPEEIINSQDTTNPENYYGEDMTITLSGMTG